MFQPTLELQSEMKRTYRIQRLQLPIGRPNPYGYNPSEKVNQILDMALWAMRGIFSFEYMGLSEFEDGSVESALAFLICESLKKELIVGEHEQVYYICPRTYERGVKYVISDLLGDEHAFVLCDYCGLKERFTPQYRNSQTGVIGWLELDNGFFFFVDNEMFKKTKHLFGIDQNPH
jgi:hypothetical protein